VLFVLSDLSRCEGWIDKLNWWLCTENVVCINLSWVRPHHHIVVYNVLYFLALSLVGDISQETNSLLTPRHILVRSQEMTDVFVKWILYQAFLDKPIFCSYDEGAFVQTECVWNHG